MAATLIAILLALAAATTGGIVYASDGAAPGDPLYGVDRAVEQVRLALTAKPEAAIRLRLELAEERLLEVEELAGEGDLQDSEEALAAYGEQIAEVARLLGTTEGLDEEALSSLLDEALATHDLMLRKAFPAAGEEVACLDEDGDGLDDVTGQACPVEDVTEPESCVGADPFPPAQALADLYDVSYDEIMGWFCDGYGIGEIMLALRTGEMTGLSADEVLSMKDELGGWGLVWQELELIGGPAGHGPREETPPGGPPDHTPGGPPDDVPAGPPDDVPGGPPDNVPGGPPDNVPGGPPDNVPGGPPDEVPSNPRDEAPAGPPDGGPGGSSNHAPGDPPSHTPGSLPDQAGRGRP